MKYVTIARFAELSGYTVSAIETKIARGVWAEGIHYIKAPDRRRMINIEAVEKWLENEQG